MCPKGTVRWGLALGLMWAGMTLAQTSSAQTTTALDWRRIGDSSIDLDLAGPASGPVDRVWFAPDGSRLYARTAAGRIFETADFERWIPSSAAEPPKQPLATAAGRTYSLGAHLQRSDDGGRTWTNLTAFGADSVIGTGQRDLAVSPRDPEFLAVANAFGVWASADGGLSWTSLNQTLPNLAVRKILAAPNGLAGARITVEGIGPVESQPGAGAEWRPVEDARPAEDAAARRLVSASVSAEVTALAGTGEIRYAGSADGRLWVSTDRGRNWRPSPLLTGAGGPVESIAVDPQDPRIALAALGGRGVHLARTTNTGVDWDDLTTNLADVPLHAVAFDRAGRAVYAAGDRGVYLARMDLDGPASAASWISIGDGLPRAAATDVQLAAGGNQVYVALDGFGVFAAAAPHRRGVLRVVSAADLTARPAAPGSLMSVLGGAVSRAAAGDLNVPVLAAGETESQIQVPFEAAGPTLSLSLDSAGLRINLPVPLQTASPAIFVDHQGAPMLLDADTGAMLDARSVARPGTRVQILATGLGRVRPDWPTGLAAPLQNPPEVRAEVVAYFDRTPVPVSRATLAPGYVGFYLIEFQIPRIVNAGPVELFLVAGGQESNRVRFYVEP